MNCLRASGRQTPKCPGVTSRSGTIQQVLPGLAGETGLVVATVFIIRLTGWLKPARLGDLNAVRLDEFAALLRAEGKSEASIRTYNWHTCMGHLLGRQN